jgi:transposase
MRQVKVAPYLSVEELERRYRRAQEPHERSWWQILWLLARGQTARQVAESTGYSAYWIGQLARRYNRHGPDAMRNRQRFSSGGSYRRPQLLSAEQQDELRQALAGPPPGGVSGDLWTARAVAAWMSARLGRAVAPQRGWDYLQRLQYSPQVPRPRHTEADPEAQATFKKSSARS